jgi:hypothetical protein
MDWATAKIYELLEVMERRLKRSPAPKILKEVIMNRFRVLKSEGYADDVAFCKALKEHGADV